MAPIDFISRTDSTLELLRPVPHRQTDFVQQKENVIFTKDSCLKLLHHLNIISGLTIQLECFHFEKYEGIKRYGNPRRAAARWRNIFRRFPIEGMEISAKTREPHTFFLFRLFSGHQFVYLIKAYMKEKLDYPRKDPRWRRTMIGPVGTYLRTSDRPPTLEMSAKQV